jgi:FtsH-binding integral membrane protein
MLAVVALSRRFERYLAGSVLVVIGVVLLSYLLGFSAPRQLPALFLIGVGVVFCILAVQKMKNPVKYEMSARTTFWYGVLALAIGVLWFSVIIQTSVAEYLLVLIIIFFGLVFLAYSRGK